MTLRRVYQIFACCLLLEVAGFVLWNRDLLYLRQPAQALATEPAGTFAAHASGALARKRLTASHLDRIAETAGQLHLSGLEIEALERQAQRSPHDGRVQLRLADALRRGGDYQRAERIYLELLRNLPESQP